MNNLIKGISFASLMWTSQRAHISPERLARTVRGRVNWLVDQIIVAHWEDVTFSVVR